MCETIDLLDIYVIGEWKQMKLKERRQKLEGMRTGLTNENRR